MASEHDGSHNGEIKVLERIDSVIGKEAVDEVVDRVWDEERKRMRDENWRVFTEGTLEERDAIADRTFGEASPGKDPGSRGGGQ